ncbi:hypothetical protein [Halorussus lipolyticus]|uniref:hypothetical protein n=1 Tax=Halorussus lipolyticus TaxID=3034024 RepID=UPI0023E758FD|nr:hypothetical protein [Halorussus sp. DT80]
MSTDKKRVQFRAPSRLIERADSLASVFGSDRTDILIDALREYLRDAAHDDEIKQEIAGAYYDGENAAVTLANDRDASLLLCDEFNKIGLVHASLDDVSLATTPKFLLVLENNDLLSTFEVRALLDEIGDVRSWDGNSYVTRSRDRL